MTKKTIAEENVKTVGTQVNLQPNLFDMPQKTLGEDISTDAEKMIAKFRIVNLYKRYVNGALQGLVEPGFKLGTFFYFRNQDKTDAEQAVRFLQAKAAAGDKDAQHRLGICFMRIEKIRLAAEWLDKAGSQGSADALYYSGKCHERLGEKNLARQAYHQVAVQGSYHGFQELIRLDNLNKQKFWPIMEGAYRNDLYAQYKLGNEYISLSNSTAGTQEKKDLLNFGLKWLKEAAIQGHEDARELYNNSVREHQMALEDL